MKHLCCSCKQVQVQEKGTICWRCEMEASFTFAANAKTVQTLLTAAKKDAGQRQPKFWSAEDIRNGQFDYSMVMN